MVCFEPSVLITFRASAVDPLGLPRLLVPSRGSIRLAEPFGFALMVPTTPSIAFLLSRYLVLLEYPASCLWLCDTPSTVLGPVQMEGSPSRFRALEDGRRWHHLSNPQQVACRLPVVPLWT